MLPRNYICTIQIAFTLGSQKGKSGSTLELIDNEIENENDFEIVPESANGSTGTNTVPKLATGKTEEKKPEHSKGTSEDNIKGMYDRFRLIIPVGNKF